MEKDKELRLQPRLQCLADLVPSGARLADVGTDHAYLPVWLLTHGRIRRAVASDINAAPLAHARRVAEAYGVAESIDFRLCAGLDAIRRDEADTVAIAGMGGETILTILKNAAWDWTGAALLLQPMTKPELLRRWLTENGFHITSEHLARDKGVIYVVIQASTGQSPPLTNAEAWCGTGVPYDPLYGEYVRDRIKRLERAESGIRQAKTVDSVELETLNSDITELRRKIREWEDANRT